MGYFTPRAPYSSHKIDGHEEEAVPASALEISDESRLKMQFFPLIICRPTSQCSSFCKLQLFLFTFAFRSCGSSSESRAPSSPRCGDAVGGTAAIVREIKAKSEKRKKLSFSFLLSRLACSAAESESSRPLSQKRAELFLLLFFFFTPAYPSFLGIRALAAFTPRTEKKRR